MSGITLAQAQSLLDSAIAALQRAHDLEEYSIAGRSAKRSAVETASADVDKWDIRVKSLSQRAAGRSRARTIHPSW